MSELYRSQTRGISCIVQPRALITVFASTAITALSSAALAQVAPSRTLPERIAPETPDSQADIQLPETRGAVPPAGAATTPVTVAQIAIEGGDGAFAQESRAIVAPLENHAATVADLYAAAGKIEALYARAGRVLTRATVPPQTLSSGGTFRIAIIEGFIENVDVSGVPERLRGPVKARVAGLEGKRGLTLKEIERAVLLAGDLPGLSLRSTLVQGEAVGATRLVLEGKSHPLEGGLDFENGLGAAYANEAVSVHLALNGMLGLGEQFYVHASTPIRTLDLFDKTPLRRVLGVGAIIPLGRDGLTLNPEYIRSDTNPRLPAGALPIRGRFERFAIRASWPAIRLRRETLVLNGGFEMVSERQTAPLFAITLNEDRLRLLSFGIDWRKRLGERQSLAASVNFRQGLSGLGARTLTDVTATGIGFSRLGSRPDFSRMTASLRLDAGLGKGFTLTAQARGAASLSGALPAAEQFALDGAAALSAFQQGRLTTDSGGVARAELARSVPLGKSGRASLSPYSFAAYGAGHVSRPTIVEQANIRGWSAGGGVRFSADGKDSRRNLFGTLEVARGHTNRSGGESATRVSVSVGLRF